jgi:hypothetical protein
MKCHLCEEDLTWDNVLLWKLNDRSLREYGCRNKECQVSTSIFLQLIVPDEDINYYQIRFPHRDRWYQVTAFNDQNFESTIFSDFENGNFGAGPQLWKPNPLIKLPRFMPLNWHQPLPEQVDVLREKLKTLLIFL